MTKKTKEIEKTKEVKEEYAQIAIKKGDKTYIFMIPVGSPLGEAFDASVEVSRVLLSAANKYVEKNPKEDEKVEEEKKE